MVRDHKTFSLHVRNGIYYVQLWNPVAQKYSGRRSTGKRTRDEAIGVVTRWLESGVPKGGNPRPSREILNLDTILSYIRLPQFNEADANQVLKVLHERDFIERAFTKSSPSAELLVDFLKRVWKEDGPYVKERRAYRHRIGLRHLQSVQSIIKNHWGPEFQGKVLGEITRPDLKAFVVKLSSSELAPKTINKILSVGTAVLRWAYNNDLIPVDPTKGVTRFANIQVRSRGILETEELKTLFKLPASEWVSAPKDGRFNPPVEREKAAFALAATTGLRLGEIAALRRCDIDEDRIYVRHSWSDLDRLKSPKNGNERSIPILPSIRKSLIALAESNPFSAKDTSFIFWGRYEDRPVDPKLLSRGFNRALAAIGIDETTRKDRCLTFHSLRHGFAKTMADSLAIEQAMKATGHLSQSMFIHYSDHATKEDFTAVADAQKLAFSTIVLMNAS